MTVDARPGVDLFRYSAATRICHARVMGRMASRVVALGVVAVVALGVAIFLRSDGRADPSAPWTLIASSPAQSTIVIQYFHGDCDRLTRVAVEPVGSTVTVSVHLKSTAVICDGAGKLSLLRVRLGAPLGRRTIRGQCSPADDTRCPLDADAPPVPAHLPEAGP